MGTETEEEGGVSWCFNCGAEEAEFACERCLASPLCASCREDHGCEDEG